MKNLLVIPFVTIALFQFVDQNAAKSFLKENTGSQNGDIFIGHEEASIVLDNSDSIMIFPVEWRICEAVSPRPQGCGTVDD